MGVSGVGTLNKTDFGRLVHSGSFGVVSVGTMFVTASARLGGASILSSGGYLHISASSAGDFGNDSKPYGVLIDSSNVANKTSAIQFRNDSANPWQVGIHTDNSFRIARVQPGTYELFGTSYDKFTIDTSGNIAVAGTVDGRDLATDGSKLDGIEASADVTDATNVQAAGALMDSELTNVSAVKGINQALTTTSTPTFSDLTVSDDLKVNDFARIDALRVGTTNTDPGDKNLYVEGVVTNHSTSTAALSFYEGSTTNNDRPVAQFAAGGRDSSVPVVRMQHQGTISDNDIILDLDFTNDGLIEDSQNYIIFQNVHGIQGHIDQEVVYSTFTGGHISQRPSGSSFSGWKQGMVVKSTGDVIQPQGMFTGSISMAWPVVDLTTSQKDKSVMGVFTRTSAAGHNFAHMDNTLPAINYNAVGEGMVLVTDTNGNIETGDYLCSSARTGHTEKQDDDILHNYTVAKATQPIDFSTVSVDSDLGYKSVLVACTYHCG